MSSPRPVGLPSPGALPSWQPTTPQGGCRAPAHLREPARRRRQCVAEVLHRRRLLLQRGVLRRRQGRAAWCSGNSHYAMLLNREFFGGFTDKPVSDARAIDRGARRPVGGLAAGSRRPGGPGDRGRWYRGPIRGPWLTCTDGPTPTSTGTSGRSCGWTRRPCRRRDGQLASCGAPGVSPPRDRQGKVCTDERDDADATGRGLRAGHRPSAAGTPRALLPPARVGRGGRGPGPGGLPAGLAGVPPVRGPLLGADLDVHDRHEHLHDRA